MPIDTDLNVDPYFDDYDPNKGYHRILFKPSTAVQARELTQSQSILQDQIEKFGRHIFIEGSIVEKCDISYERVRHYIKIKDTYFYSNGVSNTININLTNLLGFTLVGNNNLTAKISTTLYANGSVSGSPDLKTIYIDYIEHNVNIDEILQSYFDNYMNRNGGFFGGGFGFGFENFEYPLL